MSRSPKQNPGVAMCLKDCTSTVGHILELKVLLASRSGVALGNVHNVVDKVMGSGSTLLIF